MITTLKSRFEKNMHRHPHILWEEIETKISQNPKLLETLKKMEETDGEPDVFDFGNEGGLAFVDWSAESPKDRRSLCYDEKALQSRKENKPRSSMEKVAQEIGIELLTESEYRLLQSIEKLDQKTSSWLATPEKIRTFGGAIFGDRRYDTVFIYHNGADSYYAARGFRGKIHF